MKHRLPTPSSSAPAPTGGGLHIAVVERETGLGKDTLRVWEKRYGFPIPERDSSGDRRYSEAQVQRLKQIRRLLDAGLRPGKVVGLDDAELQALLALQFSAPPPILSKTKKGSEVDAQLLESLVAAIGAHDPTTLRQRLRQAQLRMGLFAFVNELVAPLTTAVGTAWAQGRLEVYEEHLYTEVITSMLRQTIGDLGLPASTVGPRVLLTTLPQETHGLGLLMVELVLTLEGCTCVSLGTQTPLSDIVTAAQAHCADVVGLSFTNIHKPAVVEASLRELRTQLPARTALWVGGSCTALYPAPHAGIEAISQLSELPHQVQRWRQTTPSAPH